MRIRPIHPRHDKAAWSACRRLHEICFPDFELIDPVELPVMWWGAYERGRMVGFCALWPSVRTPLTGYLARAAVDPDARGKGLQRRFIKIREKAAKAQGWLAMITDTAHDNIYSSNNMIRCGYLLYEPEVKWAQYDNAIYWRKYLERHAA